MGEQVTDDLIEAEDDAVPEEAPVVARPVPPPLLDNLAKARAAKAAKKELEMSKEKQRTAVAPEIDPDKVSELLGLYDRVSLEIKRTDRQGKIGTIDTDYHIDTKQLNTLEKVIENLCGGGDFVCRVRDRDDLNHVLIDKFRVRIEAPPRPKPKDTAPWATAPLDHPLPTATTMQPPQFQPQFDANMNLLPPPPTAPIPPMIRDRPAQDQWYYLNELLRQQQAQQPQVVGGERIALQQVQQQLQKQAQLEAQLARKEEQISSVTANFDAKIAMLTQKMEQQREEERRRADKAERDAIETRHAADLARLEAKFGEKKSGGLSDPAFLTALGTILTPFVVGYMENARTERKLEMERFLANSKMTQDQQKEFQALMLQMHNKKDGGNEAKLMDLLIQQNQGKTESNIMMLKAISEFTKDMSPAEEPFWLGPVKQMLGAVEGAVAMAGMKAGPGGGGAPPALPAQGLSGAEQPAPTTTVLTSEQQFEQQQWARFAQIDQEAARITFTVFQNPQLPAAMRTPEFRTLIFNLHLKHDPEKLADAFANHLEHLRDFGLIPAQFTGVFEQPKQILGTVVRILPIYGMDAAYANAFVEAAAEEITAREEERLDDTPVDDPPLDTTAVAVVE